MDRQSVTSTNLESVGYDAEKEILEIRFHSGGTYQYYDVPAEEYEALMKASSKGSYFVSEIKDCYEWDKVG